MSKNKEGLEQQYIALLEHRIAQLESVISQSKKDIGSSDEEKVQAATSLSSEKSYNGAAGPPGTVDGNKADECDSKSSKESGEKLDGEVRNEKDKPVARVRHVIATLNQDTLEYEDVEATKASKSPDEAHRGDEFEPTIFRRYMAEDNPKKPRFDEIEIVSEELKRLYYGVTASQKSIAKTDLGDNNALNLSTPFKDFIWHWDKFEYACKPVASDTEQMTLARDDLKQLMVLIRKSLVEPYFKVRETFLATGQMPHEYLWTLFPPGAKVCARTFMEDTQILEVRSCSTPAVGDIKLTNIPSFRVHCIGLDWDGSTFSAFEYTFTLKEGPEQAETQIDALEVYPLQYNRNKTLREDLIKRGERFWDLCKPDRFLYDYNGAVLAVKPSQTALAQMLLARGGKDDDTMSSFGRISDAVRGRSSRKEFAGKIIVDANSFLDTREDSDREPPLGEMAVKPYSEYDCSCKACMESPILTWQRKSGSGMSTRKQYERFASKDDPLSRDRLMMCPPRVLGYALKGKMWAQFRISSCKDLTADSESRTYFQKQLQLDDRYKQMLNALVQNHKYSRPNYDGVKQQKPDKLPTSLDPIEGKGKGLAILLHGPPGVGKTLTAETMALATSRPLLVVSVAEIGTKAQNAESNLNFFFALAARWGAILLIDEADVFLEERLRSDNPERNMLVSVLLRSLEYYEGIIFLTTNRIRSIDVAVQSRMHLAIQYKRLQQKQKANIYKNLLEKVPDSMIKSDRENMYKTINDQLCRRNEMNGRQIRNIVHAALALAKERGKEGGESAAKLKFEDLRRVHETTTDFLESLKDTTNKARQRNEAAEEEEDSS